VVTIVGIQFKGVGRIYYFDPAGEEYKVNDYVIVETVRGLELGKVIIPNQLIDEASIETELKPIVRRATEADLEQEKRNQEQAIHSFDFFKNAVEKSGLEMKPLYCEYTIDRSKVIFYYTADDRVDFRDLLKVLTPEFAMRVELRQIGSREAARCVGGLGSCGRPLCCATHLRDFNVVTMKMAKDQQMSLNTTKISGACGKLMCCIAYESELYQEIKKEMPPINSWVKTPTCDLCKVVGLDFLKKTVKTLEGEAIVPVTHPLHDVELIKDKDNREIKEKNHEYEGSNQ